MLLFNKRISISLTLIFVDELKHHVASNIIPRLEKHWLVNNILSWYNNIPVDTFVLALRSLK